MIKKGLIPILLVSCLYLGADDIDDIVNKIKKDRVSSINKKELLSVKSPLIKLIKIDENNTKDSNKSKKTESSIMLKRESFNLDAIMNNSALINGKWYKEGDKIYSYVIKDIMDDSVYLKDGNKTKIIFFKPLNNKIKIIGR